MAAILGRWGIRIVRQAKCHTKGAALRDVNDLKRPSSRVAKAIWAAFLLGLASNAHAEERILRYLSDVQVQKDGSLEVAETIDVRAEHDLINHGIFRDFPTRYRGRNGGQVHVGFTFEGATLDGSPVPASTEPVSNGVRIKVGDPDKLVDIGEHSFVLHYRTTRQVGRFSGYDELYWNATGNGWKFPIDVAEARIRLPQAVRFGQRAFYTGPQGSTASDAEVVEEQPGDILFRTTKELGPNEGLTVAVAFPKGVVAEPPPASRLAQWFGDYGPPLAGLLGLIGLVAFYYVAWRRAGRNPRAGTVVPIFSPADDLSPAAMRYVTKMNADNRTFAAALVDMGVRGHVRLVEEDRGWLSGKKTRLERLSNSSTLPDEEEAALDCLCRPGEEIMMEQKNHSSFSAAQTALGGILKTKYEGKLFKRNIGWAVAGALLFAVAFWIACISVVVATDSTEMWQVGVVVGSLAVCALLWLAFHDSAVGKCLLSVVSLAALAVAFGLGMPMISAALNSGWWQPLVLPLLALPLVLSAFWWIAAPTVEGRKVLDHIAGFKQYLSITERERLDRMTAPEDTPEVFERYLPYAIALGVENRWASRFAAVLAAAQAQGRQGFAWYSGSSSPWSDTGSFVGTVGSTLASTIGSASAAPGSSSGSGGGGSSGGGGGGGGGGGW
jgi:uncharacterized membrane protein YgcG